MNEFEIAIVEANAKISTRMALRELGLGDVGGIFFLYTSLTDNTDNTTKGTVSKLNVLIKSSAIEEGIDYKKSYASNEPATYPREWLYEKIKTYLLVLHKRNAKEVSLMIDNLGNI